MYPSQQQDHASSPAENSVSTDQPERKPVGRRCLAGNVERPGVVGWQIEVVAMMEVGWQLFLLYLRVSYILLTPYKIFTHIHSFNQAILSFKGRLRERYSEVK